MPTVDIEIKRSGFWVSNTKGPSSGFMQGANNLRQFELKYSKDFLNFHNKIRI